MNQGLTQDWSVEVGVSPIIALSSHNGHRLHEQRAKTIAIDEATRLREEDPFTDAWTYITDNRIVVELSRFEVDFNRPWERAVYVSPSDAWGLHVWKEPPTNEAIESVRKIYDRFYSELRDLIERTISRHGKTVILDIHSYNHRRQGPLGQPEDPLKNPEINVGTGTMNRSRWDRLVDTFIEDLRKFDFDGRHLDVRENVRFRGANVPFWIHTNYPETACTLAIEVKKFFMDEWSGALYEREHALIKEALKSTIEGLIRNLAAMC